MAKKENNGTVTFWSGWIIFVIGLILLLLGYVIQKSIILQNIQINLIPLGWIAFVFGGLILIFHYLSKN